MAKDNCFFTDDFWRKFYPLLFDEQSFQLADAETDVILALTQFVGGRILDLGCGAGRHALAMAARGLEVEGMDQSAFLLNKGKQRSVAEGLSVTWTKQDMRKLSAPGAYSLVLNMYTSFGFYSDQENAHIVKAVYDSLQPGGSFFMEIACQELFVKQPAIVLHVEMQGKKVEQSHIFDAENETLLNTWKVEGGEDYFFRQRLYSAAQLEGLFSGAKFSQIQKFGDYDCRLFDEAASRLIIVGKK